MALSLDALQLYCGRRLHLPPFYAAAGRTGVSLFPYTAITIPPKAPGLFTVSAAVSPSQQTRVLGEIRSILSSVAEGITEEEFLRARAQVKSSYILGLETVAARATYAGRNELLENRTLPAEDVLKELDSLTPADVNELAKTLLTSDNWALSVAGAVKEEASYLSFINP